MTFTTNGNVLTITSDRLLDNVLVAPTRNRVNTQGHPFFVWYNGSYQVMLGSQADPSYEDLPVYFRVRAVNPTGSMKLVKTTEDGKNLSGWKFGIYSDSGCSNLISGPHTTDSTGALSVSNLTAGTVYVKELGHDTTYLGITTGEDYCTLVTCTPFGVNTHRLLVHGSRIPYEEAEEIVSSVSSEEGAASTWEEKYVNGILTGLCIVGVISIIAVTVWYIRRR